ncbi:MAG: ABC transporter permease [Actinomycetota bacterium]
MLTLALRDLQYRKWRVLVVALLISIVITLLFIMTGLVNQFQREPFLATERIGGTRSWLVAESSTGPLTSPSAAPLGAVESIPGAEPVLIGMASLDGMRVSLVGRGNAIDEPVVVDGNYPEAAGEILVDESGDWGVGDVVELGGRPATVVGTTRDATILAGVPIVFSRLDHAQQVLANGQPVVTGALLERPVEPIPAGMKELSATDVGDDGLVPLDGAIASVGLTQALLWLMTLIIIAAVIYVTALERTRDFAVLKAVGGDDRVLGATLVIQGVLITLLAVAIGAVLQSFLAPVFPMTIRVPGRAFWQLPLGGVLAAVAAGFAGARKAANTPAAEAFE